MKSANRSAHVSRFTFDASNFHSTSDPGGNPMTITHIHWVRSGSAGDDRAIAYAGRELARYLGKLTGARPAVRAAGRVNAQPETAWLGICDRSAAPPTGALLACALGRRIRDLGRGRRALHRRPERAQRVVRRLRVPGDAGRALRAAWAGGRGHPGHRRRDAAIDADRGDGALPPSRRVHRGRDLARRTPSAWSIGAPSGG